MGSIAYMFERKGRVIFGPSPKDTALDAEEWQDKALEHIIELDLVEDAEPMDGDTIAAVCDFNAMMGVKQWLEAQQYHVKEFQGCYVPLPDCMVEVTDEESARQLKHLMEKLEELWDVVNVYSNAIIP